MTRRGDGVVGTVMSNFGLEQAFTAANIPFIRAPVGDRYVLEKMREENWQIGGESSGHILCLDLTTTGDGIIAALQVLCAMISRGETLYELKQGIQKLPQKMINVAVSEPGTRAAAADVTAAAAAKTTELAGRGRVLIRPSGTEPVVRVMVEGEDPALVNAIATELADVVGQ